MTRTESLHIVQLFDSNAAFIQTAAEFLLDGYMQGGRLLVAFTPEHWALIVREFDEWGVNVQSLVEEKRLIVFDANATLSLLMPCGRIDAETFEREVGAVVEPLANGHPLLHATGEMVNMLASRGDFAGACELEALWTDLAERYDFAVFCGYTATHFRDAAASDTLRSICGLHTHVQASPVDRLAHTLIPGVA